MDRDERHEHSERDERLSRYLTELQDRIDPRSMELLMRLLREVSTSPAAPGGTYELGMGPAEKELFTPALQAELLVLFGLLSAQDERVVVDLTDGPHALGMRVPVDREQAGDADSLRRRGQRAAAEAEQRERDRREVEGIARASGMEP
jgi:hypothetical protein